MVILFQKNGSGSSSKQFTFTDLRYWAPERYKLGALVNKTHDIYSYGVIMWEILACEIAWKGYNINQFMSNRVLNYPNTWKENHKIIISNCVKDGERYTIEDIYKLI